MASLQKGIRFKAFVVLVCGVAALLGQHTLPALPQSLGKGMHFALLSSFA
jgi:hypothetical protein